MLTLLTSVSTAGSRRGTLGMRTGCDRHLVGTQVLAELLPNGVVFAPRRGTVGVDPLLQPGPQCGTRCRVRGRAALLRGGLLLPQRKVVVGQTVGTRLQGRSARVVEALSVDLVAQLPNLTLHGNHALGDLRESLVQTVHWGIQAPLLATAWHSRQPWSSSLWETPQDLRAPATFPGKEGAGACEGLAPVSSSEKHSKRTFGKISPRSRQAHSS